MDGYEAARQLCRRSFNRKRPRIIAMTGNAMYGDRERCLDAGMDEHISKPMRIADVYAVLERWGSRL
jgi:CheY-like chemotaxis protein